tara:strand:- start:19 stop:519 length:501 start_codon:yes stop_codon:yes gene_type:complete
MTLVKQRARGILLSDTFAFTGTVTGAGKILQVKTKLHSTETGANNQDTETFNFEESIALSSTSNKVLVICNLAGLSNGGAGRMTGKIRWETTSGGVTGTQVVAASIAQDSFDTSGISDNSLSCLISPSTTSTIYIKTTIQKNDSGTQWYIQRYSSQSSMILMEVSA